MQDTDGLLLVVDPSQPQQEKELEQLYLNFAQANKLTIRQCFVLGIQLSKDEAGLGGWNGLQGKLKPLPQVSKLAPGLSLKGLGFCSQDNC